MPVGTQFIYSCALCTFECAKEPEFKIHIENSHLKTLFAFDCKTCGTNFPGPKYLKAHENKENCKKIKTIRTPEPEKNQVAVNEELKIDKVVNEQATEASSENSEEEQEKHEEVIDIQSSEDSNLSPNEEIKVEVNMAEGTKLKQISPLQRSSQADGGTTDDPEHPELPKLKLKIGKKGRKYRVGTYYSNDRIQDGRRDGRVYELLCQIGRKWSYQNQPL